MKEKLKLYRDFQIRKEDIDEDKRIVKLTFSSEFPVDRYWFIEILDHKPDSVMLDRLKAAGPLLVMHDRAKQVGVIENASIGKDKRGYAEARFGRSVFAEEIFQDVKDGIRQTVSVGYMLHEAILEKETDKGPDEYRVTKWEPFEISLEPTPADYTIGVNRNVDLKKFDLNIIKNRSFDMNEEEKKIYEEEAKRKAKSEEEAREIRVKAEKDADEIRVNARKEETERVKEIMAIGERFNMISESQTAIKEGTSVNDFRKLAMDKLDNVKHIDAKVSDIGMSEKEIEEFSIQRAIQNILNGTWKNGSHEKDASDAVAKKNGVEPRGFFVPSDVLLKRKIEPKEQFYAEAVRNLFQRDILSSAASGLIATDHLAGSFIDLLRNRSRIIELGAVTLAGLQGNVSIPKQTGAATAYWINNETTDTTESTPTFGALTMGPKTVSARVDYTRKMLLQSNPGIEMLITNDLINVLGSAIDLAAIDGAGTAEPTGILNTDGIGDVVGTSLDWAAIVEFETDVAAANGDIGTMAYLTNATIRGMMKTREKATSTAQFLCTQNECNGYPLAVSNQVPESTLIFGVFAQIIMGFWSGLDIKLDEVTLGDRGGIVIRAFQDCDIGIRQAVAFSASDEVD